MYRCICQIRCTISLFEITNAPTYKGVSHRVRIQLQKGLKGKYSLSYPTRQEVQFLIPGCLHGSATSCTHPSVESGVAAVQWLHCFGDLSRLFLLVKRTIMSIFYRCICRLFRQHRGYLKNQCSCQITYFLCTTKQAT